METPHRFVPHSGAISSLDFRYLGMIGLRRLWLFFACFVPVVLLAVIYLIKTPRLYESTAVVQVEQREQHVFKSLNKEGEDDDLKSDDVIKTIEQNLQNYTLFVAVVSDPKITGDPDFFIGYKGSRDSIAGMAEWLRSNTKVALRHGTRLIDITVDHQNARMAQKLAQAVIDTFVLQNDQAQSSTQQSALKFLAAQSDDVKENLQKSEDSLQIYKDSLVLKDRIDDQQRVLDALRQRYREKHPQLIQARMLLADLLQTFDLQFKKVITNSTSEASYWASQDHDLANIPPEDRVATELKLVEARSEVLQKEVDTESALFDNVLKQMRETGVSQDAAATEIRLVQPPYLPDRPAKPKKSLILLLGLAAGTALGVGVIALLHLLDSSIQTPADAEAAFGLPLLGTIPQLPKRPSSTPPGAQPPPSGDELVVRTDPGSAGAEAFRSLRAVINLLGKSSEHRTLLFTSALPGEGKTFVSCNYAVAQSQAGLKTLLFDTDLRRPAVHTRFKLPNKIGFVEMVTQDLDLEKAVHHNVAPNLDVLTAGGKCPNPAELLAGSGFKDLLEKALTRYDRIILDSSPVNLVSDSLLIAGYVDTVCLVVQAAITARQAPQHAVTMLRRVGQEPAGIILNAVPPWSDRLYLGYKGNAAYGHNYA